MQELGSSRPPTPPHQPTFGVCISREEIENITTTAFPNLIITNVTQTLPGKSFNNRVYFIKLRQLVREEDDWGERDPAVEAELEVVLKVNGRLWGANKVENEVSSLQLLQRYCPSIPVPLPLAWSGDGYVATFATPSMSGSCSLHSPTAGDPETLSHGGWILMTKLPGRVLADEEDLGDAETMVDLAKELGDIVACWRQNIPTQKAVGDIRFPEHGNEDSSESPLNIRGVIVHGLDEADPITDVHDYYRLRLEKCLSQLESVNTYAPNRCLARPLREFIQKTLPQLKLVGGKGMPPEEYVFTHYDLAPRNILISSDQPPKISGIVDFEFAGFFPPTEEFLISFIDNDEDFPIEFYNVFLDRLEELGIATPAAGFEPTMWNRHYYLERLVASVAPWDLPGACTAEELAAQLEEARSEVRDMLRRLGNLDELQEPAVRYGEDRM